MALQSAAGAAGQKSEGCRPHLCSNAVMTMIVTRSAWCRVLGASRMHTLWTGYMPRPCRCVAYRALLNWACSCWAMTDLQQRKPPRQLMNPGLQGDVMQDRLGISISNSVDFGLHPLPGKAGEAGADVKTALHCDLLSCLAYIVSGSGWDSQSLRLDWTCILSTS